MHQSSDLQGQPQQPIDVITWDCDSTLSHIEGIDWMAAQCGVGDQVAAMTQLAMSHQGVDVSLYERRLSLVRPSKALLNQVQAAYWQWVAPDAALVIAMLKALGKSVWVLSAGLQHPVAAFVTRLGVERDCVQAVATQHDQNGAYLDFDRSALMIQPGGKAEAIAALKSRYNGAVAHIGDGVNDLEVLPTADRFIGYGGAVIRGQVATASPFYIRSASMLPALPLLLTVEEVAQLSPAHQLVYQKARQLFMRTAAVKVSLL